MFEDRLDQAPTFQRIFADHFEVVDRRIPEEPGWFRARSGLIYAVVLTARSGRAVPFGLEIWALPEQAAYLDEIDVDVDLEDFLAWAVELAGEPWTLDATAHCAHRIPEARPPAET